MNQGKAHKAVILLTLFLAALFCESVYLALAQKQNFHAETEIVKNIEDTKIQFSISGSEIEKNGLRVIEQFSKRLVVEFHTYQTTLQLVTAFCHVSKHLNIMIFLDNRCLLI